MDGTERLRIPVPGHFRCTPLVKVPWGVWNVPHLLTRSAHSSVELSEKLKDRYGVKYCVLTDSARSAWNLYLQVAELDGEVIIPSFMYTPLTVLLTNRRANLVFCDVEADFCASLRNVKDVSTRSTKAVVVQHMFGQIAPMDHIYEWAQSRNIQVLANLVQVPPGAKIRDKPLGSYFDVGFLSFSWDKPIHGIYGGALLTNDGDLYEKVSNIPLGEPSGSISAQHLLRALALYRWKAFLAPVQKLVYSFKKDYYTHDEVSRFYEAYPADAYESYHSLGIHRWQSAFANKLLDQSREFVARRIELAALATDLLSDVDHVSTLPERSYENTFLYFPVLLAPTISRYQVGLNLARRGIETKWRYYPLHLQNKFARFRHGNLKMTEDIWWRYLLLPVVCGSHDDVEYVAFSLKAAIAEVAAARPQH